MNQEIFYYDHEYHSHGPYSLEEFSDWVNAEFDTIKQAHAKNNFKITRFELLFESEYEYYGESRPSLKMKIFRLETDEEVVKREQREADYSERKKKELATKAQKKEEKKRKQEELEKDSDYKKFKELQKKFKS